MYNFKNLKNKEFIDVLIFNKNKQVKVFSTGDSKYDENGKLKPRDFDLNNQEIELLNYLLNNVNLEDYKNEIVEYCNEVYEEYSDKRITIDDIENEVNINAIAINITDTQSNNIPNIAFWGDCECDEEHGICIGFKDNVFVGIASQDWLL